MIDKTKAEAIAERYYNDVYKYCFLHLDCNETYAEDITQEVFLFFQKKCSELEDKNIKAWLIKTAKNKIHEHFRDAKKDNMLVSFDDKSISFDEFDFHTLLDEYITVNSEEIEKYKELVFKELSKKEKELYTKIYIEKKKHKEIAEELNTSEKAVTVSALRLRKKITILVKLIITAGN